MKNQYKIEETGLSVFYSVLYFFSETGWGAVDSRIVELWYEKINSLGLALYYTKWFTPRKVVLIVGWLREFKNIISFLPIRMVVQQGM